MSFSSEMQAAIDELDRCDAATILHNLMPMMKAMDAKLDQLLERTAPKSSCVFCTVEDNKDNHFTARCSKFPDSVSRAAQASKLHLCVKCLKPEHDLDCGMKCGNCGLDHNSYLCSRRRPHAQQLKRPRN
ncbi:hypothetical protein V3C99_009122 [Haemonchus contortus]